MTHAITPHLRAPTEGWLALTAVFWLACSDDSSTSNEGDSDSTDTSDSGDTADTADSADTSPSLMTQVVTSDGWTATAETPVLNEDGTIVGSVTFARTSGAETRGGGTCLVADLNDGFPCLTDADCAELELPEGGHHYCGNASGSSDRICWTRPGGDPYCHRNQANAPGTYSTSAVPGLVDGVATTWVAWVCMGVEANPAGCASGDPSQYLVAASPALEVVP